MQNKNLTLLALTITVLLFTSGCTNKINSIRHYDGNVTKNDSATYGIKVRNTSDAWTSTVASSIEKNSAAALEGAALTAKSNDYGYFAIDYPDAIANTNGSMLNTPEEYMDECGYNTFQVAFNSKKNRCNSLGGGAYIRIIAYRTPPREHLVYDVNEVLRYFEENNLKSDAEKRMQFAYGKSKIKTIETFRKQCRNGDYERCNHLGALHDRGEIVAKDNDKAISYYTKACTHDIALGCYNLGVDFKDKDKNEKAQKFFRKGCDLGYEQSCDYIQD